MACFKICQRLAIDTLTTTHDAKRLPPVSPVDVKIGQSSSALRSVALLSIMTS